MFANVIESEVVRWRNVMRGVFALAAVLVLAFLVTLMVRPVQSYNMALDGWGVAGFELLMGVVAILRFYDPRWREADRTMRLLPLVVGVASIMWALGDLVVTIEQLGGARPPAPSYADIFYVAFYPVCYLGLMTPLRYGRRGSFVATALDGVIATFGAAALAGAYVFQIVRSATSGDDVSTVVALAYPVGDVLLLALALGALALLPKTYRPFFAIASVAMVVNFIGDAFNLLQNDSRIGYVADSIVWPVSVLLLALAVWAQPAFVEKLSSMKAVNAERANKGSLWTYVVPAMGVASGVAVVVSAEFVHVDRTAVALATITIFVSALRLALTVRNEQGLSSARFRSLIENAADLIIIADDEFAIAYVTPSSLRILGFEAEELTGRSLTEKMHPDDIDAFNIQMTDLSRGIPTSPSFECRMRDVRGAWRTIAWTATDLRSDLSIRGYVLNGADVTEERRAADDLISARDTALSASRAKSEFLSTMSHEIRTPMNGVIGLTDLLLGTHMDADQLELASGIRVSAENLLNIINDILDFSKIEAGHLEVEEIPFSVEKVADNVGRILSSAAANKNLELLVDVDSKVPASLLGDAVRLQQVLLNLGANAVKFTAEGEVIIRVSAAHEDYDYTEVRFEVIDTGLGIALEDQDRLFGAFAQADSSTTRKYGGTGLGLSISRQLIELMGGKIHLESTPGTGSRFWFDLPLAHSDVALREGFEVDLLEGRRALVVDDNATNRMILRRQLRSWGVDVHEADSAERALELATKATSEGWNFDIGILDLNMPTVDGIELAARIKADPTTSGIKLFLLSSSGERLGREESRLRGFSASLTKPVRQMELYDQLAGSLTSRVQVEYGSSRALEGVEVGSRGTILLVEDNKMNQLVGSKMLEKLGYRFSIARHGGEAVQAVMLRTYDAILMDCQMPEMDGYEATAHIRRWEGDARHTPIIAMTAAATEGDRDKCLNAGMDDYITKPVRADIIDEALDRWLHTPHSVESAPVKMSVEDHADGLGVNDALDEEQIHALRSLDDGVGEVMADVIDQYVGQFAGQQLELREGAAQGDSLRVERAAHSLRGASVNVGATRVAHLCEELEEMGRAGEIRGAEELLQRLDIEVNRVLRALDQVVAGV